MLELFQTEWCPASQRIRQRLTELGLDYVNHEVPVEREQRTLLFELTGSDTVPTLPLEDRSALVDEDAILTYLARHCEESGEAEAHRAQGGKGAPPLSGGGMRMLATGYTLNRTTLLACDQAVERVRAELKAEGFGVLCEIDVQATLREKLGVEGEPYLIIGACNPALAHQALQAEPELGVLLPCNVIVYERDGETRISAIDPERMLSIVGNDELAPVAAAVKERLSAVVERACAS